MAYSPTTWVDSTSPFINATNLNHMETGIAQAHALIPGGGTGSSGAILVAAQDADAAVKAAADYVCDGTADQTEINTAIDRAAAISSKTAAGSGTPPGSTANSKQAGHVILSGGTFQINGSIIMKSGVWMSGQGVLTEIRCISISAVSGAGANVAAIKLNTDSDHMTRLSHFFLNGNYSAGGSTCHGINYDMSAGGATSGYPTSSPDGDHWIHDLFVDAFSSGSRHAIWLLGASGTHNRGNMISNCQVRNASGDGIRVEAASDSFLHGCHVGTIGGRGIAILTGNMKVSHCKTFFCDTTGFYLSSGRGTLSSCESQDDFEGYWFDAAPWVATGITADTASQSCIRVSSDQTVLNGFCVFNRSGGRYATSTRGVWFDATFVGCLLMGIVDPTNITTPVSGAPTTGNYIRIVNGDTGALTTTVG